MSYTRIGWLPTSIIPYRVGDDMDNRVMLSPDCSIMCGLRLRRYVHNSLTAGNSTGIAHMEVSYACPILPLW